MFSGKNKLAVKGAALSITVLICFSILPNNSKGQIPFNKLSLDSCISTALQHHPLIQSANFYVAQQEQLKKTNFVLDPLNIQYQHGQINSDVKDFNVNVSTGIPFPFASLNQGRLQKQNILLAHIKLNVTKNELIQKISAAYYQLMYGENRFKLLVQLDSIYTEFANYANKKFHVGESNQLEKISAEGQLKQIQLKRKLAENDVIVFQIELQQLIGVNGPIEIPKEELKILLPPAQSDTALLMQNSLYNLQQQQVNVSIAEWKYQKMRWGPTIQFGAFNQSIERVTPYWGYVIGTSIPLFKTGQSGRVNFANLQSKIAQSEFDNFKLNLLTSYTIALQQYNQYREQLKYYDSEGRQLTNKLKSVADISYKAGDISYVEFILSMSQYYEILNSYLDVINNYNQSVINLKYLMSK